MKRYNIGILTKRIIDSGWKCFTLTQLQSILSIDKESSLYSVISRLVDAKLLVRAERDKYVLADFSGSDFILANFFYDPSYVSFESALSFYGVLSQFPLEITSVTVKLPRKKEFDGHVFGYYRIQRNLFWGYLKRDGYLIAEPEKAFLDQAYLATKGLKKLNIDEYDMTLLNRVKVKEYMKKFPQAVQKLVGKLSV